MNTNNKFTRIQQHNIHNHVRNNDLSTFSNLLNSTDLSSAIDDLNNRAIVLIHELVHVSVGEPVFLSYLVKNG